MFKYSVLQKHINKKIFNYKYTNALYTKRWWDPEQK